MNKIKATAVSLAFIALTLTACEEKNKKAETPTEPPPPTATQQPTQEVTAVAEKTAEKPVLGSFTDTRDNKTYKTVKIGEQVWMGENLNYETVERSNCFDDVEANCKKYGRLYEWETAKKACPNGWHLPSNAEWQTLVDFAGGKEIAGKKLKAKSGWNDNGNGEDEFGFAALPGGSTYDAGNMFADNVDGCGFWWSSSDGDSFAYYEGMCSSYDAVNNGGESKYELYSVRCLQN